MGCSTGIAVYNEICRRRRAERAEGNERVKGGAEVEVVESKEVYGHLKDRKDNNQRLARRLGGGENERAEVGRAKSQGSGLCLGDVRSQIHLHL